MQLGTGAPGWRGIAIAPEGLTKARGDLTLDLCGIAKGWALDRAADLARAEGVTDMLLDLGGEFVALGTHPEGRDWRIAVESPLPAQPPTQALRLPPGMAVATSGVRAQSYVLNGRLYSHIIDPETRAPASGRLRSVTVAAGDAMPGPRRFSRRAMRAGRTWPRPETSRRCSCLKRMTGCASIAAARSGT